MREQAVALIVLTTLILPILPAIAEPPRHWLRQADAPTVVTIIDHTGDALWHSALREAAEEWNAGIDHVDFVHTIATADCEKGAGPFTVVVCVHANSQPNYLAEARWRSEDGHLTDMVIWMGPRSNPNRARLSCHELGHALGLDHRMEKDAGSCMTPSGNGSSHPDQQDFQTVTNAHAHMHP